MMLIGDLTCSQYLNDPKVIETFMRQAIAATGLQIAHFHIQEFKNGSSFGPGITGMALLSESHMVVHTAPERRGFNLDLFSCKPFDASRVNNLVHITFRPDATHRWEVVRR